MWHRIMFLCALISASAAWAMQTGDAYVDAASAVVGSPKPAPDVMAIVDGGDVDPNQPYADGMTLMHYAAVTGRVDVMKGLLQRGGRLDVKRPDGKTALDLAKAPALVAYLISIGAMAKGAPPQSVSQAAKAGGTPAKPASAEVSPRRKMCNERHYSSLSLCSDSTCKMREYRKWQTCLQTGSYS